MKKLALVLGLLVFAVISYGQNTALDVSSVKRHFNTTIDINKNLTYKYYYGSAADTVSNADSLWNYDIAVLNLYDALDSELRVSLDSVSGSPQVTVTLQGKWSYVDSYTDISSATWYGTSSDTTISISNATNKNYRFYNILLDGTATAQKSKVSLIEFGVSK